MVITPWPKEAGTAKIRNVKINNFKHFNTLSITTHSDTSNGAIRIDVAQILIENE